MQYKIKCPVKNIGQVVQDIRRLDKAYLYWLSHATPDIHWLTLRIMRNRPASETVSVMYTETEETATLTYQSAIEYLMIHVADGTMELYYTYDGAIAEPYDDDDDDDPNWITSDWPF